MLSKSLIAIILQICLPVAITGTLTMEDELTISQLVAEASCREPGKLLIASDFNGVLYPKIKGKAVKVEKMKSISEAYVEPLVRHATVDFYVVSSKPESLLNALFNGVRVGVSAEHDMVHRLPGKTKSRTTTDLTHETSRQFFDLLSWKVKNELKGWTIKDQGHIFSANYKYPENMEAEQAERSLQKCISEALAYTRIKFDFEIVKDQSQPKFMVASTLRGKGNLVYRLLKNAQYTFGISLGDKPADVGMHQGMSNKGFAGVIVGENVKTEDYYHLSGPEAVYKLFQKLAENEQ